MLKTINRKLIRIDGDTQGRVALNQDVVAEYKQAIADGAPMPPVVVFFDGSEFWLADGFHRFFAQDDKASMPVDVRDGTQRAAQLFSIGANDAHGLQRSNADKRKSVLKLLNDPEWSQWSDRQIAKEAKVSGPFVGTLRASLTANVCSEKPSERVYTTRHGATATMKTGAIGAAQPPERPAVGLLREPRALPAKTAKQAEQDQLSEQAFGGLDPEVSARDEIAVLQGENDELHAIVKAVEAAGDDPKAEVAKWRKAHFIAERNQAAAQQRFLDEKERAAWNMAQLRRCGKAVGEDDPKKIALAVEKAIASVKGAA